MCPQNQQLGGTKSVLFSEIGTPPSDPKSALLVQTKTNKKRVEKNVSFSQSDQVEEIISRHDMTPTELEATWYDQLELMMDIKDAIDDVVDSLPPVQCWMPWTRRKREECALDRKDDVCTRGIEHEIDYEAKNARSVNKKRVISVVFRAQQTHKVLSTQLSKISEKHSQPSREYAREMGRVDEATAADIYYQDMLNGMPLLGYESCQERR